MLHGQRGIIDVDVHPVVPNMAAAEGLARTMRCVSSVEMMASLAFWMMLRLRLRGAAPSRAAFSSTNSRRAPASSAPPSSAAPSKGVSKFFLDKAGWRMRCLRGLFPLEAGRVTLIEAARAVLGAFGG